MPKSPRVNFFLLAAALLAATGCRHARPAFYPIGIYAVNATDDFAKVHEAGFNLVTTPLDRSHLDAAQARGLRVLASPGTSAGPGFSADKARRAVAAFDRHPALWAWYLVDEPDLHKVPPGKVRDAHRFLKTLGATKPTALVIFQGPTALDYANITDVMMIDRYPIPWLPLANFPQHLRMARLALGRTKPLIAVIQAFDWTTYPELLPGRTGLRPPTYEELRCMTYCALVRQANGLMFYCFNDDKWSMLGHPPTWQALTDVVGEVNARLPLFAADHVWWPYDHDFEDREAAFNGALESSVAPALLRVRRGNGEIPPGDYVVAVNTTERTHQYRLKLPAGITDETVRVLGEGRSLAVERRWIRDEFGPFAVHVYGPLPSVSN